MQVCIFFFKDTEIEHMNALSFMLRLTASLAASKLLEEKKNNPVAEENDHKTTAHYLATRGEWLDGSRRKHL